MNYMTYYMRYEAKQHAAALPMSLRNRAEGSGPPVVGPEAGHYRAQFAPG